MVVDRIILGINDNAAREKMLRTSDLTLEEAVEIIKTAETVKQQTCTSTSSKKKHSLRIQQRFKATKYTK